MSVCVCVGGDHLLPACSWSCDLLLRVGSGGEKAGGPSPELLLQTSGELRTLHTEAPSLTRLRTRSLSFTKPDVSSLSVSHTSDGFLQMFPPAESVTLRWFFSELLLQRNLPSDQTSRKSTYSLLCVFTCVCVLTAFLFDTFLIKWLLVKRALISFLSSASPVQSPAASSCH